MATLRYNFIVSLSDRNVSFIPNYNFILLHSLV